MGRSDLSQISECPTLLQLRFSIWVVLTGKHVFKPNASHNTAVTGARPATSRPTGRAQLLGAEGTGQLSGCCKQKVGIQLTVGHKNPQSASHCKRAGAATYSAPKPALLPVPFPVTAYPSLAPAKALLATTHWTSGSASVRVKPKVLDRLCRTYSFQCR